MYIFAMIHKTSSVHLTATLSNLKKFLNFCTAETENVQNRACIYLFIY